MEPDQHPLTKLPDPWLFDSEALLRELDRCRETVLQIPITNPNATHFGIQLAVNAIYNLSENLRYILHPHREQQRAIRKQHEESLSTALAENATATKANIVHLHTPKPGNGKARQHHHDRQHAARENRRRRRTFSQPAA
ncbi:MAG TPA: hypothetical protein VFA61_06630 [Candidatus Udaeobacter sp.]|nr:hypothetical protein [Candidatus Udaeobacter sp.]